MIHHIEDTRLTENALKTKHVRTHEKLCLTELLRILSNSDYYQIRYSELTED